MLKIYDNLIQGSDDWLKVRLGVATCSNFSKIVTSTGELSKQLKAYAIKLASEVLTVEQEKTYTNKDMERGNELESEARQAYQEYAFCEVKEVGFMIDNGFGYSPDGLVGDDGLIEIKCPNQTTHTQYLFEDRLPTAYKAQCQGGLWVSGRKYLDFISWNPDFRDDKKFFIKRIERDEEFIKKLEISVKKVIEIKNNFLTKILDAERALVGGKDD